MILDDHMIWLVWLEVALGPLVIAFALLIRGNFFGFPVNATFRLAGVLIGTGILLMAFSDLLSHIESWTWSRADRDCLFLAETIPGILGPLLILVALIVMARYSNQVRSRTQNEQES